MSNAATSEEIRRAVVSMEMESALRAAPSAGIAHDSPSAFDERCGLGASDGLCLQRNALTRAARRSIVASTS